MVAIVCAHSAQSLGMTSCDGSPQSSWNSWFSGIEPVTWTFAELPGTTPGSSVTEPALTMVGRVDRHPADQEIVLTKDHAVVADRELDDHDSGLVRDPGSSDADSPCPR